MSAYRDLGKLLLGGAAIKLLGIAATLVFVRVLTKNELAIFPLYFMLRAAADRTLDLGITSYFTRMLPALLHRNREEARSLLFTGVPIVYVGLAIVTVGVFLLADHVAALVLADASSAWMVRIICLAFFPYTTMKMCEYVIWGRGQFGTLSFLQTFESFVRPIAILGLFFVAGLPGIIAAFVIVEFLVAGVYIFCVRDLFTGGRPAPYPIGKLLRESFPLYLEGWLWYLRADGDSWLVSIFLGPSALAIYYVAGILMNQAALLFVAVDRVVGERLGRHLGEPDSISEKALALHSTVSRFVLPMLLWLLAVTPLAIVVIGGESYGEAIGPALVLMLVVLMQFLFMPVDRSVFVGTPTHYRFYKTLIEASAVVIAAAALVPFTGLVGIALARLAGQIASGMFGLVVLRKHLGMKVPFAEAARAILTAGPGTVLVLWLTPAVANSVEAMVIAAFASAAWLASFLVLVMIFDRQYLGAVMAEVRRAIGRAPTVTPT